MAKWLFCILVIFCVAHVDAKRISELKCLEYSKIPLIAANPTPHMAVWILQQDDRVMANDAALISPIFMISGEPGFHPSDIKNFTSRVYFAIDDWYNVIESIEAPFENPFALLKFTGIRLDSYHRPSCLWTRGNIELESVDIFLSNIMDMNCDDPIILATPLSKNHIQMSVTSINISDVMYNWGGMINEQLAKCYDDANEYSFVQLMQIRKSQHYLSDNYYINGGILTLTTGRCELRSNTDRCGIVGLNLYDKLDWIESEVWNDNSTDLNCGIIDNNVGPMILNSMSTIPNEFPWHAAIYHIQNRINKIYACGGTLINEQTVITAAHCVTSSGMKKSPKTLLVVLGKHDHLLTSYYSRECRVIDVITHHEYDHETWENDVALLRLNIMIEYSSYIQPICITSNEQLFDNLIGVLPGWGLHKDDQVPEVLQKASFPIRPKRECRKEGRNMSVLSIFLSDNNFCAGMANGTNLCEGDSGGGLVYNINNRWFLRGIASVGVKDPATGKCDPYGFSLFTDVVKIQNWIQNNW